MSLDQSQDDLASSLDTDASVRSASLSASVPASSSDSTETGSAGHSGTAAAVAAGSAAIPAWFSSIQTASIETDLVAADISGTLSYSGIETLFNDLASTLTKSKTTLTSAEMADLTTIAADLNIGISATSYLTFVTDALIDGNAANSTWTGGAAKSTTLGNLSVGASATQLTDLIGKWFLGTDLPSSRVVMTGSTPFTITYSTVSAPLFGASGPSINDVNQGEIGDCFFVGSLAEVAFQQSSTISSMITSNGNGTYGVRFYENGAPVYVTVNTQLAGGGTDFNQATNIWASLVEKAFAQLQASGDVTGNDDDSTYTWGSIGNGGYTMYALEDITGASAITDFYYQAGSWWSFTDNSSFVETAYSSAMTTATVQSILVHDIAIGDDVMLNSNTDTYDSTGKQLLVSDHVFSVYGFDSTTDMLEVRNPWGTEVNQQYHTTFEVSLASVIQAGDDIEADNMGSTAIKQKSVVYSDFDGSGTSDILFRNTSSGETYLWEMTGPTVSNAATTSVQVGNNWQIEGVGNWGGSGTGDLLWIYDNTSNVADPLNGVSYISTQSGPTATSGSGVVEQLSTAWQVAGVGDFTGDGTSDILYRNASTGQTYLDVMTGASVNWSASGFTSSQVTDPNWSVVNVADFNGDGKADVLWRYDNASNAGDPLNGALYEWQMNGTTVASAALLSQQAGSASWQVEGTGDFDGNGTADILFRYENSANASDPLNGLTYIDFMNGSTVTSGAPTQWQIDNSWIVASIGDYNGDGKADILWQQIATGKTYVWEMNGANVTSGAFTSQQAGTGWTVQNGIHVG